MRRLVALLAVSCWAVAVVPHQAAEPTADPLRFIPDQADIIFKLEKPRALAESVLGLAIVKQLQGFEAFQEFYDSTNARRFYQLVAYFEKEMGAKWPELLDKLAGGGAVVAARFSEPNAPALLVIQSKDEAMLAKFVQTVRTLIDQELARQEVKERIQTGEYRKVSTFKFGDFHAALAGSAFLISNKPEGLHKALDCHLDGKNSLAQVAKVAEARKLLPANAYGWMWVDVETARKQPGAKPLLDEKAADPAQTILFGGWLDQFRRTPFLAGALVKSESGFTFTFRTPIGRDGMNEGLAGLHLPSADKGGTLPLLEPKGVLFSMSYMMNVNQLWEQRAKLFNAEQVKGLEEFDKQAGKVLGGNKPSWLMTAAGPQQRFVVAHRTKSSYKTKAQQNVPAFAVVFSMADPQTFSQTMEAGLRIAALGGLTQIKMKLIEEKHGDLNIVGWRFSEDEALERDPDDIRFNFTPCFIAVGDQFVMSSTFELAHDLIDILQKEAKAPAKKSETAMQMRFYSEGGADFLKTIEDQLLAATVLDRAVAPHEGKEQVKKFIELVRRAGSLQIEQQYGAKDFRLDIKYAPGK
jgi:hypothetical protein